VRRRVLYQPQQTKPASTQANYARKRVARQLIGEPTNCLCNRKAVSYVPSSGKFGCFHFSVSVCLSLAVTHFTLFMFLKSIRPIELIGFCLGYVSFINAFTQGLVVKNYTSCLRT
jgi:hypothetical protein